MSEEITQSPTTTTNEESAQPEVKPEEAGAAKPALFDDGEMPPDEEEAPPSTEEIPEAVKAEDISIPEGYEYEAETGKSFLDILNDETLSRKELGQRLFDLYQSQMVKMLEGLKAADKERVKKFTADMDAEKADWMKQCESDKEFGGQKWEGSQAVINRGCEHLATPEAVRVMQAYNLNTHPEVVRMFYRAGLLVGEDKSPSAGNGAGKPADTAMAIFGESLKEYHKRRGEVN